MKDKEAVDFLKKARLYWNVPRKNGKQVTMELYIEAMTKAINALEEKTKALPLPDRQHGEWKYEPTKGAFCSECGWHSIWEWNFCPECGADMRKKEGAAE